MRNKRNERTGAGALRTGMWDSGDRCGGGAGVRAWAAARWPCPCLPPAVPRRCRCITSLNLVAEDEPVAHGLAGTLTRRGWSNLSSFTLEEQMSPEDGLGCPPACTACSTSIFTLSACFWAGGTLDMETALAGPRPADPGFGILSVSGGPAPTGLTCIDQGVNELVTLRLQHAGTWVCRTAVYRCAIPSPIWKKADPARF